MNFNLTMRYVTRLEQTFNLRYYLTMLKFKFSNNNY